MPNLQRLLTRTSGTLALNHASLSDLLTEAWARWPNETGGVLLGRRLCRNDHSAAVLHVVGPGPTARHDRYRFEPDANWQAAQVAVLWAADPTLEYLGDWHTHPGGTTRFSELDHAAARTIASAPMARQSKPFMLVAALQRDITTRVAAAVLLGGRLRPLRTELTAFAEVPDPSGLS